MQPGNMVYRAIRWHIRSSSESEGTLENVFTDLSRSDTGKLPSRNLPNYYSVHITEEELNYLFHKDGPQDLIDFATHEACTANMTLHLNNYV